MKDCLCVASFSHPVDLACTLEVNTEEPVFTTPPAQFAENRNYHLPIIPEDNGCAAKQLLQRSCILDSFLSIGGRHKLLMVNTLDVMRGVHVIIAGKGEQCVPIDDDLAHGVDVARISANEIPSELRHNPGMTSALVVQNSSRW